MRYSSRGEQCAQTRHTKVCLRGARNVHNCSPGSGFSAFESLTTSHSVGSPRGMNRHSDRKASVISVRASVPSHHLTPHPEELSWTVCVPYGPFSKSLIFFLRFYLFILERGEGRGKERERDIGVWLHLMIPLLGTWPATQAYVLTGNGTGDPLVHGPALNPLS